MGFLSTNLKILKNINLLTLYITNALLTLFNLNKLTNNADEFMITGSANDMGF